MSDLLDTEDQRPHYVYRIFDASDRLLYIGCAIHVPSRISMHVELSAQSPASWVIRREMARWTQERYPTKAEARAAERAAIADEWPVLNKQHSPRYRKNVRELPLVATP